MAQDKDTAMGDDNIKDLHPIENPGENGDGPDLEDQIAEMQTAIAEQREAIDTLVAGMTEMMEKMSGNNGVEVLDANQSPTPHTDALKELERITALSLKMAEGQIKMFQVGAETGYKERDRLAEIEKAELELEFNVEKLHELEERLNSGKNSTEAAREIIELLMPVAEKISGAVSGRLQKVSESSLAPAKK